MTPLQTLSTRNPVSANGGMDRAFSAIPGAGDARGFANMLDVFSAQESQSKIADRLEGSDDSLAESVVDQAESDQVSDGEDAQGGQDGERGQRGDSSQGSGQGGQGGEGGQGGQSGGAGADGANGELVPKVQTVDDLGQLLTNAASVDIAGMASDLLQGQGGQGGEGGQGAAVKSASASVGVLQASAENTGLVTTGSTAGSTIGRGAELGAGAEQGAGMSRSESMAVLLRGAGMGAGMGMSGGGQVVGGQAVNQPVNLPVNQPVNQAVVQSRVVHDAGKMQVAQVQAVVQAVDQAAIRDSRKGIQATQQTSVISSEKMTKASAVESVGQSSNEQTGLDLGSRAQNPGRILDANAIDDRAIQRQQVMAQVQRGLASILNTKGGTMKLRLSPEHLGQVNIRMTTKNGSVSIEIDAQNESTRQILEKGLEGLRASMETRGIQVDELAVQANKPNLSGFERLLNDSGGGGEHHATQDQQQNGNESQGDQHESPSDFDDSEQQTTRGIWTELGLDAIA